MPGCGGPPARLTETVSALKATPPTTMSLATLLLLTTGLPATVWETSVTAVLAGAGNRRGLLASH